MKVKSILILYLLLLISILIDSNEFFRATELSSKNPDISILESDLAFADLTNEPQGPFAQPNNRPVVKIIAPKDKSSYPLETRVPYEISVSDQEDGEYKYGEIPQNEVILKVECLENKGVPIENNHKVQKSPSGLTGILKSNCLNCHAFKSKLIGPSFYELTKHYETSESNFHTMVSHIKDGSTGIWGNTVMPAHPELSTAEIQKMVQWIIENTGIENINYYTGTKGSIKLPSPIGFEKNTSFMLTASYVDHGVDDGQKLMGKDSVIIYSK